MLNKLFIGLLLFTQTVSYGQSTKHEFRGIWVTTVNNLDWPSSNQLTPDEQRKEFLEILDHLEEFNLNAIFIQIRASGDAFYPSSIEPWSAFLTGKQGVAPTPFYDPLRFMIDACHNRNIEFHAWFNLVRGVNHMRFFPASEQHIYKQHPEWFFEIGERRFFNQGIPEVRKYTIDVILDVVNRYKDIDGVHLDDYFYPEEIRANKISDTSTFKKYNTGFDNINSWRRHNIDTLIYSLSDSIKKVNPLVKFGISPISVWRHKHLDPTGSKTTYSLCSYDNLYADTKKWIELNWIDYIIPQNYGNTASNLVKHESITQWWASLNTSKHRYIGNALYKWGTSTWNEWNRTNEIPLQIKIQRDNKNLKGNVFFRYNSLIALKPELKDTLKKLYKTAALTPTMIWKCDEQLPQTLENPIYRWHDDTLTIRLETSSINERYLVYAFERNEVLNTNSFNNLHSIIHPENNKLIFNKEIDRILITTLDRCNRESKNFYGIIKK